MGAREGGRPPRFQDVRDGAGVFDAQFASHAGGLATTARPVNVIRCEYAGLTPFSFSRDLAVSCRSGPPWCRAVAAVQPPLRRKARRDGGHRLPKTRRGGNLPWDGRRRIGRALPTVGVKTKQVPILTVLTHPPWT